MTVSSGAIVAPRAAGHVDELPRAGGHGPAHAQAGHGRAAEGGREAGGGAHHLGGEGGDGAAAKGEAKFQSTRSRRVDFRVSEF